MWSPTHVQILIRSAKDLKVKGTDGTNDAFVTIDLGHSKFQTSVKPGSKDFIEWFELCEMKLPKQSNNQTLTLTVYHKNLLSTDQFLGTILIPLSRFLDSQNEQKAHKTKITKCYRLSCKPGQTKTDYRGELEVGITFIVKSECTQSLDEPPLRKLSKDLKHKLSSSTISLHQNQHTFDDYSTGSLRGSYHEEFDQNEITSQHSYKNETKHLRGYSTIKRKVTKSNHYLSPEDANNFLCHIVENVDCSSHKNSFTSQNQPLSPNHLPLTHSQTKKLPKEIKERFRALSKDNLIDIIFEFHNEITHHQRRGSELEEYIDSLTAKVLEIAPEILKLS